ncbi:MAG: hypothetical protein IPL39_20260 [Opitutaceae bacterium]|nr:hypothetical protein [Opitutaceae bacterium]
MNHRSTIRQLAIIVACGVALAVWSAGREPSVAGIWQTVDADTLDMRPTIILGRAGGFRFDVTGQGKAEAAAAAVRWEMKDRSIWIIEEGKRAKLADVAEVTRTSLILSIADLGLQKFTRIGDSD